MKYAFVENNRRQYGVPALCEALQVSRSGYYAARQRGPSDRQKRRVELTARIRTIHQASRESYGAPRVHVELLAQKVPQAKSHTFYVKDGVIVLVSPNDRRVADVIK